MNKTPNSVDAPNHVNELISSIRACLRKGSPSVMHMGYDLGSLLQAAVLLLEELATIQAETGAKEEQKVRPVSRIEFAHVGWKACRRQVFALSEDFINRHPETPNDYDRGVYHAAKQFAKALGSFGPDECDYLEKAISNK